jgi:hypothetical protein
MFTEIDSKIPVMIEDITASNVYLGYLSMRTSYYDFWTGCIDRIGKELVLRF